MQESVLALENISKTFPGVKALQGVQLTLRAGEVHALLGENGAGKSTLVKVMTGAMRKDEGTGRMCFDGKDRDFTSPSEAQKAGISTVYQEVNLLPNLSVAQNLFLGHEPKRFALIQHSRMQQQARELLKQFKLDIDVTAPLNQFSVAVQQLIAIARGVAMKAKVLVLDEPTASLDKDEVETLFGVMEQLKSEGVAIVFISHFLDQVYRISDRITVLRNGQFIGEYITAELPRPKLIEAMLGKELQAMHGQHQPGCADSVDAPALFKMDKVCVKNSIENMDILVPKGQAIGMAGLLGSGRTEVCRAIFGVDSVASGQMQLADAPLKPQSPAEAIKAGVALCPEDRKTDGIIGPLSIRENIALALQARLGWWRYLSKAKQQALADKYIEELQIATPDAEKPIGQLSGGNQQKVILARWLATQPQLLVLDEPTRGIDIGAHAEILNLIKRLCHDGMSLLVTSSELEELVAFANKVVVLRDRRKVSELSGEDMTPQHIMQAIAEA